MGAFQKQLRELHDFDPRGAGVLSLYLHTDPLQNDAAAIQDQLERVSTALKEGIDPTQWHAVEDEIIAVRDYLGSMISPAAGLAIFTCTPRHFFRIVRVQAALAPAAFWAPWPHVAALQEVVEQIGTLEHDGPAVRRS
jgi:hypothetical protein